MLNGPIACLKTTLSYIISANFGPAHISTSKFGLIDNRSGVEIMNIQRSVRYKKAKEIAKKYLSLSASIILDGTYNSRESREEIYTLGEIYHVDDIIVLTCICSDERIVEQRLNYRKAVVSVPDSYANTLEDYRGSIGSIESLENDKFNGRPPSNLIFDTANFSIRKMQDYSPTVLQLANFLINDKVKDLLCRPFFMDL